MRFPRRDQFQEDDNFGIGGITWQLDSILFALEEASKKEDSREYASLAAQLAVILAPKLTPDEYAKLASPSVPEIEARGMPRRQARREYERLLFASARANVATMLRLASERGIYAKKDESPPPVEDAASLAIRE